MFAIPLGDDGAELRPLEPFHAEEFLAHIDRGREFIGRFITFPDRAADLDSARDLLRDYASRATNDAGRLYGIWVDDGPVSIAAKRGAERVRSRPRKPAGGTLVGGVLFRTMDVEQGTAEAGCWLEPAAVGRGLVTRAARVIIDWAVEERGVHRIEWLVAAGNAASIAVARRLGMTREGVLRQARLHHGERHDIEIWSVLAPEWRAHR